MDILTAAAVSVTIALPTGVILGGLFRGGAVADLTAELTETKRALKTANAAKDSVIAGLDNERAENDRLAHALSAAQDQLRTQGVEIAEHRAKAPVRGPGGKFASKRANGAAGGVAGV